MKNGRKRRKAFAKKEEKQQKYELWKRALNRLRPKKRKTSKSMNSGSRLQTGFARKGKTRRKSMKKQKNKAASKLESRK
jgi:hypothetical protein